MIFAYFAQVRTCQTKILGPTKHCFIVHGIGSSTTTDQRECGFLIVGLLVFTLRALNSWPKICDFRLFCTGPDLKNQKIGSDENCLILHGIGSSTTTDQRECGFCHVSTQSNVNNVINVIALAGGSFVSAK